MKRVSVTMKLMKLWLQSVADLEIQKGGFKYACSL